MANKVIPFPKSVATPARKDRVVLIVRRQAVIAIGNRQFRVDLTAKVRPEADPITPPASTPRRGSVRSIGPTKP